MRAEIADFVLNLSDIIFLRTAPHILAFQTFASQFAFICPWQYQTAAGSDVFQN